MAQTVAFDLVAPEKLLLSEDVEMVVLPGVEGDIGVLPGHAPVITQIRMGQICVFEAGQVVKRLFVEGGFAEVMPERCTVLAEEATPLDDIETSAVEQHIKNLRDEMSLASGEEEKAVAGMVAARRTDRRDPVAGTRPAAAVAQSADDSLHPARSP